MRIEDILHREMAGDLGGIHSTRLQTIFAATCALLRCGKATLTSMGRAIAARTSHKHGIKRIDRLLGNDHVKRERVRIFAAIARRVIAPGSRPVVIVDWTDFDKKMAQGGFRRLVSGKGKIGKESEPVEVPVITTPRFETTSPTYAWINDLVCVGYGRVRIVRSEFRRISYDIYALV